MRILDAIWRQLPATAVILSLVAASMTFGINYVHNHGLSHGGWICLITVPIGYVIGRVVECIVEWSRTGDW